MVQDVLNTKIVQDFTDILHDRCTNKNVTNNILDFLSTKIYNPKFIQLHYDLEKFASHKKCAKDTLFIYNDIKEVLAAMSSITIYKFNSIHEIDNWLKKQSSLQNCICFLQINRQKKIEELVAEWTENISQKVEKYMLLGFELDNTKYQNNSLIVITDKS